MQRRDDHNSLVAPPSSWYRSLVHIHDHHFQYAMAGVISHYCSQCGAITPSTLVTHLVELKEKQINELEHDIMTHILRAEIAVKMLREVDHHLKAETQYLETSHRKPDGSTEKDLTPTPAKLILDRVRATVQELLK